MLKKLLKYDFPKIHNFLCIFYGLSILFSLLTRLFLNIEDSLVARIIGEIFRGAAISMMFSAVINNVMRLWVLFRQNMYGDESYLTHTLPVPRKHLYASKMLTTVSTMCVSVLVVVISLVIMFYSDTFMDTVKVLLASFVNDADVSVWIVFVSMLVLVYLQFVNIAQCGFAGIIAGHKKPNKKIGMSVLYGFVTYIGVQLVILISMGILTIFDQNVAQLLTDNVIPPFDTFLLVIWVCAAIYVLTLGVIWLINTRLLKKGVDVE